MFEKNKGHDTVKIVEAIDVLNEKIELLGSSIRNINSKMSEVYGFLDKPFKDEISKLEEPSVKIGDLFLGSIDIHSTDMDGIPSEIKGRFGFTICGEKMIKGIFLVKSVYTRFPDIEHYVELFLVDCYTYINKSHDVRLNIDSAVIKIPFSRLNIDDIKYNK